MCGIAGLFSLDGSPVPAEVLPRMNGAMVHRGPDDEGTFSDALVGLAMRRLSIIGLGSGRQPIFNEDGEIAIVMNGEIYNYPVLRKELEARGHRFSTGSDVEVAVHLYEERGPEFVQDLRGMFGYALYDRRRRRLYLGRDRAGKKPLYYAVQNGLLIFASEIKAIHASGLIGKEIDPDALGSYLTHGFVVGERTMFAGIQKLPAGCMLIVGPGDVQMHRYWDLPRPVAEHASELPDAPSFEQAALRVRELLEEAVRIRLMSEVPLGAFLSGGVDSSAIVGIMSRELARPVETFAVGFENPEFDELAYAREAAELYRTNHHEVMVTGCSPDLLHEVNWFHDEPAADPANVPTLCLAKFSRQVVTVALTGEGGDELFAGYRHYRLHRQLAVIEERLTNLRSLADVVKRLQPHAGALGPRRFWKGLWIASLPPAERPRGLVSVFTDFDVAQLLAPDLRRATGASYAQDEARLIQERVRTVDFVAQAMYFDCKSQLPDQLLMKADKMTMAASLEARCPFLDHQLMEYVAALPTDMKISPSGSKLLLRQALRGLVPDALLDRRKHGFEVPIRHWMLHELAPLLSDLLVAPGAAVHRYLAPGYVRHLVARLRQRNDPQLARQVWTLLAFAVWHDRHWPTATVGEVGATRCGAA